MKAHILLPVFPPPPHHSTTSATDLRWSRRLLSDCSLLQPLLHEQDVGTALFVYQCIARWTARDALRLRSRDPKTVVRRASPLVSDTPRH